jgi:hypothetical protein
MLLIDEANDEILTEAAFQAEAEAKPGASVDTGFMRNALYGVGPGGSHRGAAQPTGEYVSRKTGQKGLHVLAPAPDLPEHTSALHGAAHYTIYQEMRLGFMYRAVQAVGKAVGGIIRKVGKKYG